jgi:glucose-6-phosphate-specific signal transduction histidine kinase
MMFVILFTLALAAMVLAWAGWRGGALAAALGALAAGAATFLHHATDTLAIAL